ncbi:sodium/proton-translocating pyrophosphatase, partial [Aegicerativicinus sediminis]
IGKGFAIASAALTALALFAAYATFTGIDGINIFKADVLAMLFVGGMIPVIFSALAMESVGKAAMEMVKEVRRQFREIPGIMEGTGKPEYAKCVDISTKAALKEMVLPGLITILTPVFVGFVFGAEPLGGYMAGVCVSGVMWAIFQNNAGGAWDNAKKSFESGVMIEGNMVYKGSDAHKAAVTGDTVGDPFKDTSGPSMNILIKLTCLVGLVIAPVLGGNSLKTLILGDAVSKTEMTTKEMNVTVEANDADNVTAKVTFTKKINGEEVIETKTFKGSETEVKKQLQEFEAEAKSDSGSEEIETIIEKVEIQK